MVMKLAVLSAALPMLLLLLLSLGTLTESAELAPIAVEVRNSIENAVPLTFSTHVASRGILIGALRKLMDSNTDFKFTYSDDPNYGPYLESVNGLAGDDKQRTYWELLVETPDGKTIRPEVGIGCYIPSKNEKVILNFTKW